MINPQLGVKNYLGKHKYKQSEYMGKVVEHYNYNCKKYI